MLDKNNSNDVIKLELRRLKDREDYLKQRIDELVKFTKDLEQRVGPKVHNNVSAANHDRIVQLNDRIGNLRVSLDQVTRRRIATENKLNETLDEVVKAEPGLEKVRKISR